MDSPQSATGGASSGAKTAAENANPHMSGTSNQKFVNPIKQIKDSLDTLFTIQNPPLAVQEVIRKHAQVVTGLLARLQPCAPIPTVITKSTALQIAEIHSAIVTANPTSSTTRTWADVAAGPKPQRDPTAEITLRPTENNNTLKNITKPSEILQAVSGGLGRAGPIAARRLRSGDIRLTVSDKEYALRNKGSIQNVLGATVLQQNYPVEVLGVPRTLGVRSGGDATDRAANELLLKELSRSSGKLVPGVQFTKVGWIPNRNPEKKTRGSLILGVESPAHRAECVRRGVLIDGQIYAARFYDYQLQSVRCYRCSRWGHLGRQCKAPPACGHCAKAHATEDCPNPEEKGCVNCKGRTHKAWETRSCPVSRDRKSRTQALRFRLLARTAEAQSYAQPSFSAAGLGVPNPPSVAGVKRAAAAHAEGGRRSPSPARRLNPVGRPSGLRSAARTPGQTRLAEFAQAMGMDWETASEGSDQVDSQGEGSGM
jgi:hypothetical protein